MAEPIPISPEAKAAYEIAANRLHHLSMRYSGAIVELAQGKPVGMLPQKTPGLREARDLIDLILFCRAEINGLSNLMVAAGVITAEQHAREMAEQYEWFTQQKAKMLGVTVNDAGIVFHNPTTQN